MSKHETNYEALYSNNYMKLPKYYAIISIILPALFACWDILAGTDMLDDCYDGILEFLVGNEAYSSAVMAVVLWAGIIFGLYKAFHFIASVSISQKIVVVNRLTEIRDKTMS